MTLKFTAAIALAGLALTSAAQAQTMATAATDLNLRAGPGPTYQILAVIPGTQAVAVEGCLAEGSWCRVSYNGTDGWASGDYLVSMVEAPIYANRERLAVGTVTYEAAPTAAIPGALAGAFAGALLGGPVGAVIGGGIGMGIGSTVTPDERVTTYVRANPVAPIYLDGEVVVGAGIPETVTLSEVPESEYYYAYVNGVPVLVERTNRRVVYIVR
jgi:uncharacterized protein YraI